MHLIKMELEHNKL